MTDRTTSIAPDGIVREIHLAFVHAHVLYHATLERIYGLGMMRELARHGYPIGPGTIYPILNGLQQGGYLACEKEVVNGKVRKYYRTTKTGQQVLKEIRSKIRELVDEVLEEKDRPRAVTKKRARSRRVSATRLATRIPTR